MPCGEDFLRNCRGFRRVAVGAAFPSEDGKSRSLENKNYK